MLALVGEAKGERGSMNDFWDSWQRPYRYAIVEAIRSLSPVSSVLEGGCNCGPNLRLLQQEMPGLHLAGFDLTPAAIQYGAARLGPDVDLFVGDWHDLLRAPWGHADVIVSCYSLSYVAPDALVEVLRACVLRARVGLVIAEPMPDADHEVGMVPGTPEYRHPYAAVLSALAVPDVAYQPLAPAWDRLNGLLTVRTR